MSSDQMTMSKPPAMQLALANMRAPRYVPGRRSFFKYRDLGVTDATGGRLRAQVTSAEAGLSQPTGWHYHSCEAQFVYMLKGWMDLDFEQGKTTRLTLGDCVLIPGGAPHQEIRTSDAFELIEMSVPGEMGTTACAAPAGPARGVVIGTAANAKVLPGRRPELQYRDFGVTDATQGRMRAQVFSNRSGTTRPTGWHHHVCDMQFIYQINGWVELEFDQVGLVRFNPGDSAMIPGGYLHQEVRASSSFDMLEVSLPAALGTEPRDPPVGWKATPPPLGPLN